MEKTQLDGRDGEKLEGISRVTWVGLWVNAVLSVVKVAAGVFGDSRALVADGVHSLTDMVTNVAVLVGVRYWLLPPDANHPYGHQRIESFITLLIGVLLFLAGVGIAYNAVANMLSGQGSEEAGSMLALVVAFVTLVAKEILFRWTLKRGKELGSEAVEANAWEHRSDAVSSIPVVIAIAVAMWVPGLGFVDMLGALIVSGFIVYASWNICHPAINTLLDKGAGKAVCDALMTMVLSLPEIREVHNLRTRYMGKDLAVDLHVRVDGSMTVEEGNIIAHRLEELLRGPDAEERLGLQVCDVLVHVDPWHDPAPSATSTSPAP